ncbi:MAG: MFS transporter [Desulfomonilia bacterium]
MPGKNGKFLVILFANFFFFLNFSQLLLLPKFIVHLGLSPGDIGLIMASFSISVLVALPIVGIVSEKIPRRYLFVSGAVLMFLPTYFYLYVDGMGPLIFSLRICQGVGFASAFGISATMVFDSAPESERRYLLGILTASNITTHALGPVFGEYMIHAYGYDMFFSSAACIGCVSCIIGLFLPGGSSSEKNTRREAGAVLSLLGATVILGAVFGSAVIFLPPYLMAVNVGNSSPFFVSFVAGSMVVWVLLYRVLKRLNEKLVWAGAVLSMIALPASFIHAGGGMLLWGLSLLFGAGYGYLYPTLNASIMGTFPMMRGVANSLFVWSFNLGMLGASIGFGLMSDLYGYRISFILTAAFGLSLLLITRRIATVHAS